MQISYPPTAPSFRANAVSKNSVDNFLAVFYIIKHRQHTTQDYAACGLYDNVWRLNAIREVAYFPGGIVNLLCNVPQVEIDN